MECCIQLAYDNILYTDYDNREPTRSKKLRLMGLEGKITAYAFNDISWIVNACDKVYLLCPTARVSAFNKAFEEVFNRIDISELDKIVIYTDSKFISWSVGGELHCKEFDSYELMHSIYNSQKTYDWNKTNNWHKMFMWTWYRQCNIEDRDNIWRKNHFDVVEKCRKSKVNPIGYMLRAESMVDNTATICGGTYASSYTFNMDNTIHAYIACKQHDVYEVLWDLFTWSKGRVSPFVYNKQKGLAGLLVDSLYTPTNIEQRLDLQGVARIVDRGWGM